MNRKLIAASFLAVIALYVAQSLLAPWVLRNTGESGLWIAGTWLVLILLWVFIGVQLRRKWTGRNAVTG